MSTNVSSFYPVLRFPSASPFASDIGFLTKFYSLLIDVVAESCAQWIASSSVARNAVSVAIASEAKQSIMAKLELGISSPYLLDLLPELLDYAANNNVELAIASAVSVSDLKSVQARLHGLTLKQPLKIFSPGLIMDYYEDPNSMPDIDYVPAVYTLHDFNLLTQMASGVPLSMLKVFPATCSEAAELKEFMQGPFAELKSESRRVLAVSPDLRQRYLGKLTKVASPSDYMMIRDLFVADKNMNIALVEPNEISPSDISGAELISYIASEFPSVEIVAAGLKHTSNIPELARLGARSFATALFKLPLMRVASGFEMDNPDQALAELREEMIAELNSVYATLPQYSSL